jgi:hypothetical protein
MKESMKEPTPRRYRKQSNAFAATGYSKRMVKEYA